jgi:putative tricarboxylic transport membrane protein
MIHRKSVLALPSVVLTMAALLTGCNRQGGAAAGVAPEDEKPVFENGVLQPLSDGFPNKTIQLINVQDAGARDGIYGRALVAALDGISPVDVIVLEDPATSYGSLYKVEQRANEPDGRDGYYPLITTLPGLAGDFYQQPVEQELGLTPNDLNPVINTEVVPYVFIQRKDVPWGPTFQEFVDYAKANPGKARYVSNQVGTGNDLAMEWIFGQLGITVKKIPAGGNAESAAAVAAGEGDFTLAQADVALSTWQSGAVNVTMVTGDTVPKQWSDNKSVVSAEAFGLPPASWGAVMSVLVPSTTPKSHVNWLYELFRRSAENPEYTKRADTVPGIRLETKDPAQTKAIAKELAEFVGPIIKRLGLEYQG